MNIILMSLAAAILKLAISRYVYKKNESSKVNILFAILFLFQALWDIGKALSWMMPNVTIALPFAKLSYTGYIISMFIFPHFVWVYLKRKNVVSEHIHLWYLPMYLLLFLLWTTDLVIAKMVYGNYTYLPIYGVVYSYFFQFFQAIFLFYMFFILLHKYFKTSIIGIKERLKFLIIGISFPILIGIPTGVILPAYGIKLFPHNNILTTFTCLFIGYGIMKYKFLSIKPLHEEGKLKINNKELQKFSLDYTNQYLVCTKNPVESSYNILIDKLSKKNYGLIITTQKPDDIRKQYNLKTTPIIWLTDLETDELSIGPNDIRQLQATIDNFTKSIPQSFVLLDGLDYLIKKNSFSKILFFVKSVKISIHCHKSIFIIPSEKYDLTQKQETMLTYEYRILPSKSARFIRLAELKRFISKKAKFIALGYDSAIESLAKEIKYQKSNITIISPNIKDKKEKHIQYIEDNPLKKQSLEKYIKDSNNYVVFVSLVNDSDTMLAINLIRSITEKAQIIANIHRTSFISIAERAGSDYVVASSTLGGHLLALSVHNPNTIRWIMEAVTRFGKGIQLKEMNISSKYVNKTVHQVDKIFGTKANIIAIRSGDYFEQIPADDYKIRKGDVLLLVHAE